MLLNKFLWWIINKILCLFFFCLFQNDLSFSGKQKWTKFRNVETVEARVINLVCWNLKVFLRGGFSPQKRQNILLINQCSKNTFTRLQNLDLLSLNACNTLFNVQLLWSHFETLHDCIHDILLNIWVRIANS